MAQPKHAAAKPLMLMLSAEPLERNGTLMDIEEQKDDLLVTLWNMRGDGWLRERMEADKKATVGKAFTVTRADIIEGLDENDEKIVIRIGKRQGGYWQLDSRILAISYDLYLSTKEKWKGKHFVAEKGVSIFPRLNDIVVGPIWVGGDHSNALPFDTYDSLIRKLPSYTELQKYVASRLASVLKEYFEVKGDPERTYEKFLTKRLQAKSSPVQQVVAAAEEAKFTYLLGRIHEMMKDAVSYSEAQWQKEILAIITLLFPKYLIALESIPTHDFSGRPRQIDLGLLDVEGNLDVIEIKKPFDACVMSSSQYRNNYVPLRELSGAIMQIEKYILYLQRGGRQQDKQIQKKYAGLLPAGLEVKIVNPRGMVILGRSNSLSPAQRQDFEVVRRKYAHIADIITYDDLIRRLEIVRDTVKRLST
jgi:hypothetical protein